MLCRPVAGLHAACFAVTPFNDCFKFGPCHAFFQYPSSKTSSNHCESRIASPSQVSIASASPLTLWLSNNSAGTRVHRLRRRVSSREVLSWVLRSSRRLRAVKRGGKARFQAGLPAHLRRVYQRFGPLK